MENNELITKAQVYLEQSQNAFITNQETFDIASAWLLTIIKLRKKVEKHYKEPIAAANKAHKEIIKAMKQQKNPLDKAEAILRPKITKYNTEQEALRIAEEKRLQKQIKITETDRRLDEAIETGNDRVLEEPIVIPNITIASTTKTDGISYKDNWKYRIIDFSLLSDDYKIENSTMLGHLTRASKGTLKIKGVEMYNKKGMSVRA